VTGATGRGSGTESLSLEEQAKIGRGLSAVVLRSTASDEGEAQRSESRRSQGCGGKHFIPRLYQKEEQIGDVIGNGAILTESTLCKVSRTKWLVHAKRSRLKVTIITSLMTITKEIVPESTCCKTFLKII
jgi:hypothetical protein